jgi:hypothetical protein
VKSASCPGLFIPGTHRTEGWVAPGSVWTWWRREKTPSQPLTGNWTPVFQPGILVSVLTKLLRVSYPGRKWCWSSKEEMERWNRNEKERISWWYLLLSVILSCHCYVYDSAYKQRSESRSTTSVSVTTWLFHSAFVDPKINHGKYFNFIFKIFFIGGGGRLSSFSIETRLKVGRPELNSRQGQQWDFFFLFTISSRPAVGPAQPLIQLVPWALTRG